MQKVITAVRVTLSDLLLAIDGTIIMSENLRDALDNIYDARVPSLWRKVSYRVWDDIYLRRIEKEFSYLSPTNFYIKIFQIIHINKVLSWFMTDFVFSFRFRGSLLHLVFGSQNWSNAINNFQRGYSKEDRIVSGWPASSILR